MPATTRLSTLVLQGLFSETLEFWLVFIFVWVLFRVCCYVAGVCVIDRRIGNPRFHFFFFFFFKGLLECDGCCILIIFFLGQKLKF